MNDNEIKENLTDAGLSEESINILVELYKHHEKDKIVKIINEHRKELLNNVHKDEKRIDCLDFFLYQLNKMMEVK